jgi:hypothetical protein
MVEVLLVEAFKKEASAVAEHFGFEDEQVGDVGGGDGVGHGGYWIATLRSQRREMNWIATLCCAAMR